MLAKSFEIHFHGDCPKDVLEDFEYLTVVEVPTQTVLRGVVPDQSALYGVLNRLHALGLELVEVRRLREEDPHP